MPRDDRERVDPNERFRDPMWSESQARQVEAMQPERSPNPDDLESPWTRYIWDELQEAKRKLVALSVGRDQAMSLARMVDQMDLRSHFDEHKHRSRSTCIYCDAKRVAAMMLGKPVAEKERIDE